MGSIGFGFGFAEGPQVLRRSGVSVWEHFLAYVVASCVSSWQSPGSLHPLIYGMSRLLLLLFAFSFLFIAFCD